jgi:benzoyl-CoA reductase subunit A
MNVFCGIDLGSTTTKAVLLDEHGDILGRGITNSRSNYFLAAEIARDEAFIGARFTLIDRELSRLSEGEKQSVGFRKRLLTQFRKQQFLSQLHSLRDKSLEEAESDRYQEIRSALSQKLSHIFETMEEGIRRPRLNAGKKSDFFRDQASSDYSRLAESVAEESIPLSC